MLLTVLLATFLVMLVSFSGKLLMWRGVGPYIERNLHFFVSFAAGVLLVVAVALSIEITEHSGSLTAGLPWIAIGAIIVLTAFRYLPYFHHHHDRGDHAHSRIDANRVLASDAIHNIGDGIVIVVSFTASFALGIASTVSIMVHEMFQEISEFFVYREAGLSVRTALLRNFLTSSTILIGVFGAYFFLERFEALELPLLSMSLGAYFIVIFHDLIPHSLSRAYGSAHYARHTLYFVVGIILMGAVTYSLPHADMRDEHTEMQLEYAIEGRILRE